MRYYLTTAIDYVNAEPHIGHALEKIQADVVARQRRLIGDEVRFVTGTDDNSLSNVRAAEQAGVPVRELVDRNAQVFLELKSQLNLSFDDFIRTTEERHHLGAQQLWRRFRPEDVYKQVYQGLYCVGCEEFKLEKDLVEGLCPDHRRAPDVVSEENYFFRLSAYQEQLEELLTSGRLRVVPEFRKNEVLAFIRSGLEDLSISRSRERAQNWGIPVPGDDAHIMYVWVDALANYLTALGYGTSEELYPQFWGDAAGQRVHLIGKGITRFHAIYWPAFLLSAGLPLPSEIVVHEYLTIDGQKMSKTLGNVIAPKDLVERFGIDATRYLLLSALPWGRDGDISWEKLTTRYTADLANGLGNLLSRTIALAHKFSVPLSIASAEPLSDISDLTLAFRFADALGLLWQRIDAVNTRLEQDAPWTETDPAVRTETLQAVLRELGVIAQALAPYMPEASAAMLDQLAGGDRRAIFPRLE